jgi:predicted transcriptional regulator
VTEKSLTSISTKKTLAHIKEHPGIRYRELLRLTGFSNGGMSFQLRKLKKSKLVKAKKLGYNTIRYYPITVKTTESDILDHLLNLVRRRIILFLLEHDNCRFKEIKHYIDRSPSTTSFQLQRLEGAGIISVLRVNKNNQFYRLKNKSRIVRTVKKYKIAV